MLKRLASIFTFALCLSQLTIAFGDGESDYWNSVKDQWSEPIKWCNSNYEKYVDYLHTVSVGMGKEWSQKDWADARRLNYCDCLLSRVAYAMKHKPITEVIQDVVEVEKWMDRERLYAQRKLPEWQKQEFWNGLNYGDELAVIRLDATYFCVSNS